MAYKKETYFKLGKFEISKFRKGISFGFGHSFIAFCEWGLIGTGRIFKHRIWELNIHWGRDSLEFNTWVGRYCDHFLYVLQFNIFKLIDFSFDICDNREWDYYKNKRTYEIEDYYNNLTLTYPVGVKPYYKPRKEKAKWYLNTQFLKIYNLDFLNDPWGLTFDWAFFPLLIYSKFKFGCDKRTWFDFNIGLTKEDTTGLTFNFKLQLFSRFIEFEIGENTVLREANLYHLDDFQTLVQYGANPNLEVKQRIGNILTAQIDKKNLAYLHYAFEHVDLSKLNTDELLVESALNGMYKKELYDYLLTKITYIKNWEEEIEPFKEDILPEAMEKLLAIKDNPLPQIEEKKKSKSKNFVFKFEAFKKDTILWFWFKVFGGLLFRFDLRKFADREYEHNFNLALSRDFAICNYAFANFNDLKGVSFRISHNNVYLLQIQTQFLGIWQDFRIGAKTGDPSPFYNFKKQRLMTSEEQILKLIFKKEIDTDEPKERKKKYKEWVNRIGGNGSRIKIYNTNYLNMPYGKAIEFALPFEHYLKFSFNKLHYYNFKNETNFEFNWAVDNDRAKGKYFRICFSLFKHYFKMVIAPKTIKRFSVLHSDKSLAKFKGAKINKLSLNNLFKEEIKSYETWIFKKVVDLEIDLSELNFDDLIYHLAFYPYYNLNSLKYMLQVAKDNNVRIIFEEENENKTNAEIIDYLKNETGKDFTESALNQLINYVEQQKELCPELT